jgi:DNA-binding transcriptional regulator LsrR (DeoR family)
MNREEESRIISLRQSRVAELLAQGYTNQSEIAHKLNVSEPTVSRDIQFLNRQAQENLKIHVERRIPFEIEKCYTGLNLVLKKAFEITNLENAKISEKVAALQVVLTTYDKMWEVILGRPLLKEVIDKFKTKQKQLEEAANEIQREREKDKERKRLGLTLEEYETTLMETEDPNRMA